MYSDIKTYIEREIEKLNRQSSQYKDESADLAERAAEAMRCSDLCAKNAKELQELIDVWQGSES